MSAIRHQSLLCQPCGSPVDKEKAQSTPGKLSARILFRHNPVFCVIQQYKFQRGYAGEGQVSEQFLQVWQRVKPCTFLIEDAVCNTLPLLTHPINAKGYFRDTASIVEVKKKYSIYYIFLLKACKLLLSTGCTRRQDLASPK